MPNETTTRSYKFLGNRMLQDSYSIEIVEEHYKPEQYYYEQGTTTLVKSSKEVFFCSTIHMNKRKKMSISFCGLFSDAEILRDNDVVSRFIQSYGADSFK